MKCVKCEGELRKEAKFCDLCGAEQPSGTAKCVKCAKCGAELKAEAQFCDACGAKQPSLKGLVAEFGKFVSWLLFELAVLYAVMAAAVWGGLRYLPDYALLIFMVALFIGVCILSPIATLLCVSHSMGLMAHVFVSEVNQRAGRELMSVNPGAAEQPASGDEEQQQA